MRSIYFDTPISSSARVTRAARHRSLPSSVKDKPRLDDAGFKVSLASASGKGARTMSNEALGLSYVLPIRRSEVVADEEFGGYLRMLSRWVNDLIVVDGSPDPVRWSHARAWGHLVRHVTPDPRHAFLNGKVNGVLTGVACARNDPVVIADDDVRYTPVELERIVELLKRAHLVRPQNYFQPLPWHAKWDTARTLINRAVGDDYPGTLAVRRSFLDAVGGYDGDVLFENLELIRTVRAAGGTIVNAPDLYVRRIPPSARGFRSQRVRQAYDDFALPGRFAIELALGPAIVAALWRRHLRLLVVGAVGAVALAEWGRRRAGGRGVFAASTTCFAPAWVIERAACAWGAVAIRALRGGVPYAGGVLRRAATSERELKRRVQRVPHASSPVGAATRVESDRRAG
jgi:hypothetical protein